MLGEFESALAQLAGQRARLLAMPLCLVQERAAVLAHLREPALGLAVTSHRVAEPQALLGK